MKHVTYKIKKSLVIFVLGVTCYMLHVTYVSAQQVNLSLDPPIVQVKIKPGKSIIVGYTVQNNGDPTNLQFSVRPFSPLGQLGSLSVSSSLEGPVQFNLENADIVLEKPFFFPSKDKKQAVVRITIPLGIPDGDYYYILLAETVPAFSVAGQSTGIASAALGSPLLISVTGTGITEVTAQIAEFSYTSDYDIAVGNNTVRIVDTGKELPIILSVRNMGKNLIQPQGSIIDKNGGIKNTFSIIPQNILSKSQRVLKVFTDASLSPSNATLTLSHLTVGRHTVTAQISFGENSSIQYKTISFLALPIRLVTITLIAFILLIIVFATRYIQKRK